MQLFKWADDSSTASSEAGSGVPGRKPQLSSPQEVDMFFRSHHIGVYSNCHLVRYACIHMYMYVQIVASFPGFIVFRWNAIKPGNDAMQIVVSFPGFIVFRCNAIKPGNEAMQIVASFPGLPVQTKTAWERWERGYANSL